jgi:hypothetical protein
MLRIFLGGRGIESLRSSIVIQDDQKTQTLFTQQGVADVRVKGWDSVPPLNATQIGHTVDKDDELEQNKHDPRRRSSSASLNENFIFKCR